MRGRDHKTGFAESLRNEYMSIMKNVESDPGATRAAFERIGASLAKMISSSPSALDHDSVSDSEAAALADMYLCSSLMYKGVQYNRVVNTPGRSAFLIGSYSVCDMRVGSMMQGVSRVHVILFLIPGKNVVLVDPGSLCGFVSKPFDQHNAPVHTHSHEESETEHTPDISPSKPAHSGGKRKQVVVYKWAQAFYLKCAYLYLAAFVSTAGIALHATTAPDMFVNAQCAVCPLVCKFTQKFGLVGGAVGLKPSPDLVAILCALAAMLPLGISCLPPSSAEAFACKAAASAPVILDIATSSSVGVLGPTTCDAGRSPRSASAARISSVVMGQQQAPVFM
ncbi:hypothetical protein Pelo_8121 [Pelomyxa schiedti]|nr:hypothetical protein Pelo_12178 [Pelomyxa schiedti]KAH3760045.1 hypothetical protein Pelo_8121 [Pelomyxa schiedti]